MRSQSLFGFFFCPAKKAPEKTWQRHFFKPRYSCIVRASGTIESVLGYIMA